MTTLLHGLILAGGQSTRMGRDKGLLDYHGQPHRFYLADLLRCYCAQVFISINAQQTQLQADQYQYLVDLPQYADSGPLGAVLGAHLQLPEVSWFVVTCDLPFFGPTCADALISQRDPAVDATAFFNHALNQPEPLVAIYEQRWLRSLPDAYSRGETSLRRLLGRAKVQTLHEFDLHCIHSADRPEDYAAARRSALN